MDMVALKKCTASQQLRKNQQWAGCKPNKFPPQGGRGDFSLDISSHRITYKGPQQKPPIREVVMFSD
jgi:hypothetical protein